MTDLARRSGQLWRSLGRRWPTALGLAVVAVLLLTDYTRRFANGLVFAAVFYLVYGVFRGAYAKRSWLIAEVAGVLVFGAATVVAILVQDRTAQIVLAVGWLAHMVWDAVHHRADAVVPRWWAEQCAVVDGLVAVLLFAGIAVAP